MTRTKPSTGKKGCCCKLNPHTFQGMVNDTVNKLYGHLDGRPYDFDDTALEALQSSAESFIETMWKEVKDIMIQDGNRQTVEHKDFDEWKQKTGFRLRVKTRRGSLCKLFGQCKKRSKVYIC